MNNQPTLDVLTFQMESVKKQKQAILKRLDKLEEASRTIQAEIRSAEGKLPALTTEMARLKGLIRAFQEAEPTDKLLSDVLPKKSPEPPALKINTWYKCKTPAPMDPEFVFRLRDYMDCPGIRHGVFYRDGMACATPALWEEANVKDIVNAIKGLRNRNTFDSWVESESL